MGNKIILIGLMFSIIAINEIHAASFDCRSAKTRVETLICSDKALSYYDELLNEEYKTALQKASDKEELENDQRDWKEKLKKKKEDEEPSNFDIYSLLNYYHQRISLIRARYSTFVYTGDGQYDYVGTSIAKEGWYKDEDEIGRLSVQALPGNRLKFQLEIVDSHGIYNIGENGGAIAAFFDNRRAVYVDEGYCLTILIFYKNLVTVSSSSCGNVLRQASFYKKSDKPVFVQNTKASAKKVSARTKKRMH